MKQNNYFQAMYKSFYSADLYRDVTKNWEGGVVLYLFLLLAICWAIAMVPMQKTINRGFDFFMTEMIAQVPEVKFTNGIASTPENHPYFLHFFKEKDQFVVIDTSGQITIDQPNIRALLTKDKFYTRDKNGQIKIMKLPNLNYDFIPASAKVTLEKIVGFAFLIIFPLCLFLSFIYRLVQAIIYAIIGKIISVVMKISLNYSAILKLAMIAVTPAIVLGTIFELFFVSFHYQGWFLLLVTIGYLIFAIRANKS